jgi:hypothetical protein
MTDPLRVTHRLGSIVGNPSFEVGLQQYTDRLLEVTGDLQRRGITGFTVRVVTGDTIELSFGSVDDAAMFRLRWS